MRKEFALVILYMTVFCTVLQQVNSQYPYSPCGGLGALNGRMAHGPSQCGLWSSQGLCEGNYGMMNQRCPCDCQYRRNQIRFHGAEPLPVASRYSRGWLINRGCIRDPAVLRSGDLSNQAFKSFNQEKTTQSIYDCMKKCKSELAERCGSVEWRSSTGECIIKEQTPFSVPEAHVQTPCKEDQAHAAATGARSGAFNEYDDPMNAENYKSVTWMAVRYGDGPIKKAKIEDDGCTVIEVDNSIEENEPGQQIDDDQSSNEQQFYDYRVHQPEQEQWMNEQLHMQTFNQQAQPLRSYQDYDAGFGNNDQELYLRQQQQMAMDQQRRYNDEQYRLQQMNLEHQRQLNYQNQHDAPAALVPQEHQYMRTHARETVKSETEKRDAVANRQREEQERIRRHQEAERVEKERQQADEQRRRQIAQEEEIMRRQQIRAENERRNHERRERLQRQQQEAERQRQQQREAAETQSQTVHPTPAVQVVANARADINQRNV